MSYLAHRRKSFDADALAWLGKMTTPTSLERWAITKFVIADKASGNWALRDDIWIRSLGSVNGVIGKNKTGAASGGITWSINGAKYNGTTGYIDNNFNLSTDSVYYDTSDANLGFFIKVAPTNKGSDQILIGALSGADYSQINQKSSSGELQSSVNKNKAVDTVVTANSMYNGVYNGTPIIYKDGIDTTDSTGTLTPVIPTIDIYSGARNSGGTAAVFSDHQESVVMISKDTGFDYVANNTDIRQLLLDLGLTL